MYDMQEVEEMRDEYLSTPMATSIVQLRAHLHNITRTIRLDAQSAASKLDQQRP